MQFPRASTWMCEEELKVGWKIEGKLWGKHSNLNWRCSPLVEKAFWIMTFLSWFGWSCVSSRYQTVHSLSSIPTSLMMNARTCTTDVACLRADVSCNKGNRRRLHADKYVACVLINEFSTIEYENRKAVQWSNSYHGRHWRIGISTNLTSNCSMQNDEELPTTSPFFMSKSEIKWKEKHSC